VALVGLSAALITGIALVGVSMAVALADPLLVRSGRWRVPGSAPAGPSP
jgi:hypothetical protein